MNRILVLHRGIKIRAFKVCFNGLRHNFERDGNSDKSDSDSDRSGSDGGDHDRAGVDDVDDVFRRYDSWLYFAVSRVVEDLSFKVVLPYIQKVAAMPLPKQVCEEDGIAMPKSQLAPWYIPVISQMLDPF